MIHATFSENEIKLLSVFLRTISENESISGVFTVTMNIDGVNFRLELKPEPPYHICITGAAKRRKNSAEFVPVEDNSVLFSLLHLYLFKNLYELKSEASFMS